MIAGLLQHGAEGGGGKDPGSVFLDLFSHLSPHAIGSVRIGDLELPIFNLQVFQLLAVVAIVLLFAGAARAVDGPRPSALRRITIAWVEWIRDEMVYPVMGRDRGRKFLPFFLSVFFFVLGCNLIGLLPHGATATANVFVTGGLAAITLFAMPLCGMAAQGPLAYWKNLVPHGVPALLWPLMFVLEAISLLTRPFALMVRLFANMTAGHLVILSFVGLIQYFGLSAGGGVAWAVAPVSVAFAAFIMIIESFVALLQAYVFTLLSIVFVGASVHPEH
ncbi:MAG: F0F1 ATP synthase subunit A [Planctomycetes bacterium]|nr:F0F1 ATP synthase subunit A [Planctomycetota bacterium]